MTKPTRLLRQAVIAGCAVILGATAAHADAILTYTASFGPELTDWSGTSTPVGQGGASTVSVPEFNPALGTLQSVLITVTGTASSTGHYTNNGTSTATISGAYQVKLDLMPVNSTGDNQALSTSFTGATPLLSAFPTFGNVSNVIISPNGGTYYYTAGANTPSTESVNITALSSLAAYEGSGTLVFPLYTTTFNDLTGTNASNVTITQVTDATAGLTITYDYTTSAPEPASMAILASALGGLVMVRRRRKR